ncbi:hypothetical protein PMZ80_001618 [Knufia obscura]|uniref:Glycosyltransferase family 25 protein n=1 Tax=Knufia obscura TaxID=1635080 RepID=A0ABR0S4N5_9EURO|nr:hypothetical protein PMZ80_001618 [Knufia obscura]
MPTLQNILFNPRAIFIAALATISIFFLSLGQYTTSTTSTQVASATWLKGTHDTGSNKASALQRRISDIYNSTLGFQKILAISLHARTDRRDSLTLTTSLTNITLTFIDGVRPTDILEKTLPPYAGIANTGARGAWRGHINAMREVVSNGWGSALILEEDADWDVRVKEQLRDFAVGSLGVQMRSAHAPYFAERSGEYLRYEDVTSWLGQTDSNANLHVPHSPYGSDWDVLWLGNCGMRMNARREDWNTLAVVRSDDETAIPVPDYHHWDWEDAHPYDGAMNHSRWYLSQPTDGVCSIAYAVSQRGARRILLELGMERADKAFDLMLQDFCQGVPESEDEGERRPHSCWGVVPPLFAQYRGAGREDRDSDIAGSNENVREQGFTNNIQRSVRVNARKLVDGLGGEIVDSFPYGEGT